MIIDMVIIYTIFHVSIFIVGVGLFQFQSPLSIIARHVVLSSICLLAGLLDATIVIFQPMNWYNPGSVKLI